MIWVLINLRRLHYQYRAYFYLSLKEVLNPGDGEMAQSLKCLPWEPEALSSELWNLRGRLGIGDMFL